MKTKFNLSKIMKEAHRLVRVEGLSMSQALKLAWSKARRSEYYQVIEVREPKRNTSIGYEMNLLASSLSNYYANNTYNGD